MLSKSQAQLFFWAGTIFFSGIFLFLTVDTIRKVPEQTSSNNITEEVAAGKRIWEENNCMGCHTILGEGAYYAPELTKAYPRRGEAWLKVFLKDPQAMFPGERKMVQYNFSDEEIKNVIAFLKWISEMDLNGFPADPPLKANFVTNTAPVTSAANTNEVTKPAIYDQLCTACHTLAGQGGNVGPALDGVGTRYETEYLRDWLEDPQTLKPGTTMPKLPLSTDDIDALVDFLSTLK